MTHEEAINEIKSWDFLNEKEIEVIQTLIPELRESEDERINKAIFKALSKKDARDVLLAEGVQVSEALAYLEKQKKPKKEFHIPDYIGVAHYNPVPIEQKEQKPNYCHHGVDETGWSEEYRKAYYDGWNNCNMQHEQCKAEQKPNIEICPHSIKSKSYLETGYPIEQKPAEWSKEDNIGWDEAFACVTRAEKAAKNEEELQNAVTAERWLKEIKFKYCVHPQSKQEWSEEDEKILEHISNVIDANYAGADWQRMIDWLKSLRPQPKQEWNEKDNEMFHCICDSLCHLRKLYETNEDKVSDYNAMIVWFRNHFKSIRSSWKPSKEQMEELMGGLRILPAGETYHILLSLYNDLKKL